MGREIDGLIVRSKEEEYLTTSNYELFTPNSQLLTKRRD